MSIKVLVVDDSLFMRRLISDMLSSEPGIEVIDTARNGSEAMLKIPKTKPDCITLDLMMPGWDGLTTLKNIMNQCPTPVVILSAHSQKDADITIECLEEGAVGFVLKPSGELSLDIETIKDQLIGEVMAASKVEVHRLKSLILKKAEVPQRKLMGLHKIIVIGASTGGPQTLRGILSSIPGNFPLPILIAQHMPTIFFTEGLATHLNSICQLPVCVAEEGQIIQAGRVYLAPGGFHMTLEQNGNDTFSCLSDGGPDSLSPSIDMTMKSAAQTWGENAVGIILTGMGNDGLEGMRAIKEAGGQTIVQDESSLIFGMPQVVIEAGLADRVLPASEMATAILDSASQEREIKSEKDARE